MSARVRAYAIHAAKSVLVAVIGFGFILTTQRWWGREAAEFAAVIACSLWQAKH